jgi:5-formyltetrahydrofolate cyclo-ligase
MITPEGSIIEQKRALRALFRKKLLQLTACRRQLAEKALCNINLPSKGWILSFASCQGEISTHLLNQQLAAEGRLLLPRIEGAHLKAYKVSDLSLLQPGQFGILEPICKEELTPDFILVPALAFSSTYHRLGRGKGYYDRYLLAHAGIPNLGIGFTEQSCEHLPFENHDLPLMDCILL